MEASTYISTFSVLRSIFRYNEYERDRFVEEVSRKVPAGARILDAGAGPCKYRPLFAHCEYKSQDFAKYQGGEHRYGELDYVCDITAIPAPDASFDCILSTEVLEHLPRPDLAIREFARLLKRGGHLFLTAPLGSGIHMPPYHFYGGFTPNWYDHFLGEEGIDIVSCTPNGGFFKLYGQESQRFLHIISPTTGLGRLLTTSLRVLFTPWFRMIMPIVCHLLDRFDKDKQFTAGYFVTAVKRT
jgi:SAM-dependent methyltransferase